MRRSERITFSPDARRPIARAKCTSAANSRSSSHRPRSKICLASAKKRGNRLDRGLPRARSNGHEVGHHVQNLLGILGRINARRERSSDAQANALSVRLELQADCLVRVHNESRGSIVACHRVRLTAAILSPRSSCNKCEKGVCWIWSWRVARVRVPELRNVLNHWRML
jgi:hypothetical protein